MSTLPEIDITTLTSADPLASVEYEGKIEPDSKKETSAILEAFKARAKQEAKRMRDATDSEYWFAVCFGNREEKEQFLHAINMIAHGDKYIDGRKLAEAMGINLDKTDFRSSVARKSPKLVSSVGTI